MSNLPRPEVVSRLFSWMYLSTETLPAVETFCVLICPNCTGGSRKREGTIAHADAAQALVIISLQSRRISSGVLLAHNGDPPPPLATFVLLVTSVLFSSPKAPVVVSPI